MPKPKRTELVRFRSDPIEKQNMEWAAAQAGMTLGAWLRSLALRAIQDEKRRSRAR